MGKGLCTLRKRWCMRNSILDFGFRILDLFNRNVIVSEQANPKSPIQNPKSKMTWDFRDLGLRERLVLRCEIDVHNFVGNA